MLFGDEIATELEVGISFSRLLELGKTKYHASSMHK